MHPGMGFGKSNEGLKLSSRGSDTFLGCSWIVAHVPHVKVGFDEFIARFFGDNGVSFGPGIVYVGGEFGKGLQLLNT